jgi:hypothetical protein
MGGFSASVQKDLNNTPPPPPTDVMGNMTRNVAQAFAGKGGSNNAANQTFAPQTPAYKTDSMGRPDIQMDGGFASGVDTPEMYNSSPFRQMDMPNPPTGGTMGGKGSSTNSATSGQPRMGQPNNYANTIPQWDNASQQMAQPAKSSGKGKGG